jgi:hypothetical protein
MISLTSKDWLLILLIGYIIYGFIATIVGIHYYYTKPWAKSIFYTGMPGVIIFMVIACKDLHCMRAMEVFFSVFR